MNTYISATLVWLLASSLFGLAIFPLTKALAGHLPNAASRCLLWKSAFLCVLVLSTFAASRQFTAIVTLCATSLLGSPGFPLTFSVSSFLAPLAFGAWSIGALILLALAVAARVRIARWRSAHFPVPRGRGFSHQAFARTKVHIALDETPQVPVTWGFFSPVILLPKDAVHWDESRLHAALLHELGHIHRFDNLAQLCALLVCSLHWFNPVFWFAARHLAQNAEFAADDFAMQQGLKPSAYAEALLMIAHGLSTETSPRPLVHTAILNRNNLETRLLAIVNPNNDHRPLQWRSLVGSLTALAAATLLILPIYLCTVPQPAPSTPTCHPPSP